MKVLCINMALIIYIYLLSFIFQRPLYLFSKLEHLQLENANEWALREKLETDKLSLERENKRLKADLNLVSEELSKIRLVGSCNLNKTDVSNLLQEEINEKSKVNYGIM